MYNLTDISTIKSLLNKHGFSFSKSLGQNFLINPSVCPRIAELGSAQSGFGIIEIGPGLGVLTKELAARADKVAAVEIDKRLIPILTDTMSDCPNVSIINADILKTNLDSLIKSEFPNHDNIAVCANLPYYITSPIIMHILESRIPIRSLTVMLQKEAAARICAPVGSRLSGAITVAVNYFGVPKKLFDVSRGSFIPAPNVDSSVIRIDVHQRSPLPPDDEALFFKVVRAAFSQRRKTLTNSLSSSLSVPKSSILSALDCACLSHTSRAEEITIEQFISLSQALKTALI